MIKELTIENTNLPAGWELTALGKVCAVIAGQSPESKFYNTNEEGLAFYQGKKEFTDKYIGQPTKWTTKITKEAIKNDILMSVRAPVGPVNFSIQKCCIGRGLAAIRASEKIDKEYLYNFLVKFENEIEGNEGAVFNSINKSQIGAIPIPLPPLPEQKQIVAILDKAFTAIDTAKANAEQNLKNAKELFKSYLQNVFENKGDDWEDSILGKVCGFQNGFAFKSKDSVDSSNTQVVRMGNLYQNKLNLERKPAFYSDSLVIELGKYLLKENDLIISLTGTTGKEDYGYTVKIPEVERNLFLNQRIAKFIIKDEKALARDFLFRFLLSRVFLDELFKTAKGTRQANLSTEIMKSLPISYPTMKEQKLIIQKLDSLSAETKKLEAIYTQKIADLEEMKKSVLQKAFSGHLNTVT